MFFNMFFKHKTVDQVVSSLTSLCSELREVLDNKTKEREEYTQLATAANEEAMRAGRVIAQLEGILS